MYPKSKPRIIRGYGGTPVPIQRVKIALAKYRSWPVRKLRCLTGFHNPPVDKVFEEYGVVFIGGACTECGDDVAFPVCTLMDVFHRPNSYLTHKSNVHTLQMGPLNGAVNEHMRLIGCDDAPRTSVYVIKSLMQCVFLGYLYAKLRPTPS